MTTRSVKASGVYVRISDDRAGAGLGVKRQEQDCRALAETRGWLVTEVYTDNDVSAYRGATRPAYERLLDDLRAGRRDAVLAWHPDRLHRSPRELEDFIDLIESTGAAVATVQAGDYDLATAAGRMTARVVGAVARHESEHKSERNTRKHLELALAGQSAGGGTRPFGYETQVGPIRESEAVEIRRAADRILAGDSVRSIVNDWRARGILSPTGNSAWHPSVIRRMLTSARVAGLRAHHGEVVADAVWPAILDRATWERVRAVLLDPARRKFDGSTARRYLLTGFLFCSYEDCAAQLVARPREDRRRCYVCAKGAGFKGCGRLRTLAEPLEEYVALAVQEALSSAEFRQRLERPTHDLDLAAALQADEAALRQLDDDHYVAQRIPRDRYLRLAGQLQERITSARHRLAESTDAAVIAGFESGEVWEDLSFDRQRSLIGACVERVELAPAIRGLNRFDPRRVKILWRA